MRTRCWKGNKNRKKCGFEISFLLRSKRLQRVGRRACIPFETEFNKIRLRVTQISFVLLRRDLPMPVRRTRLKGKNDKGFTDMNQKNFT